MNLQPVVYQGTFDPFTNGHLAVVKAAQALFGQVVVLLLVNPAKKPLFTVQERKAMIEESLRLAGVKGVQVDDYQGLLAAYMQQHGLRVNVRGIRNGRDSEFELENHRLSRQFYPTLETVLLPCEPAWADVSSSALKTACASGRVPAGWAPKPVFEKLKEKFPSLVIF